MEAPQSVRVFVSYAHDSEAHKVSVRQFCELLSQHGVDAIFDQLFTDRRQDWPRWMSEQIDSADYVIVIASPAYRRVDGPSGSGASRGVRYEATLLTDNLYRDEDLWFPKILPVLLPGGSDEHFPRFTRVPSTSFYAIPELTDDGIAALLRVIRSSPSDTRTRTGAGHSLAAVRGYLTAVVSTACRWPDGWSGRSSLPDPAVVYGSLRVVATRLVETSGTSGGEGEVTWPWAAASADHNLIVLFGDAGQGKTWTLQNEARTMAQAALDDLDRGAELADLELPLFCPASMLARDDSVDRVDTCVRRSVEWAFASTPRPRGDAMVAVRDHVSRGGRVRPLIDGLDEVPNDRKGFLWAAIRECVADRRAVLSSRRFGFDPGFDQFNLPDACLALRPYSKQDVVTFAVNWYGGDTARAKSFLEAVDRSTVSNIVFVPLFLTMLAILNDNPERLPQTSAGVLEAMARRILGVIWKFEQRRAAERIDDAMEAAARLAWHLSTSGGVWRDQIEVSDAVKAIMRSRPGSTSRTDARAELDELGGLLVIDATSDPTSAGLVRFNHRLFHEFFTALHIARLDPAAGARKIDDVWWLDPDWTNTIPLIAGLSPAPESWIRKIAGDRPDTFGLSTTTALRCVVQLPSADRPPLLDRVVDQALTLLATLNRLNRFATAYRVEEALVSLPIEWNVHARARMIPGLNRYRLDPSAGPDSGLASWLTPDDLLDEIDAVLEENNEEFVRNYYDVDRDPYRSVRVESGPIGRQTTGRVVDEWLTCCPDPIRAGAPGPASGTSPWSLVDLVHVCRDPESRYSWPGAWLSAVVAAIQQGEIAINPSLAAGLLLARDKYAVRLAVHVLTGSPPTMTDQLVDDFRDDLGPLADVAAAAALQFCVTAESLDPIRSLFTHPDPDVRAEARISLEHAEHEQLVIALEPLVADAVPGVSAAIGRHLPGDVFRRSAPTELLELLAADDDPEIRGSALAELVNRAGRRARRRVRELLSREADAGARSEGIRALTDRPHEPWIIDLAETEYLRYRDPVTARAWAHVILANPAPASASTLTNIAGDRNLPIGTRINAARVLWQGEKRDDVIGIAAAVAADHGEPGSWHIDWSERQTSRSDVELLTVLLEHATGEPGTAHPLLNLAEQLIPKLGVGLRDIDLRNRFRSAIDRLEASAGQRS
ncbi:NACHT domain-containing protein [Virgisporangium aurantiacum]|uniref:Prokaryotic ubiquitin-like protein Pup n=1 Tax=Virgisporangium aurantiacum TaxID=175570 RepID=A0A8J3Z3K8_9ACTN|nr:ubiquitin-like protein Pup [Virgisporangium aurantiacum]GIJ54413.1 hypothetical protein Vau01_019290 [Virgisporangium aurantiacum]